MQDSLINIYKKHIVVYANNFMSTKIVLLSFQMGWATARCHGEPECWMEYLPTWTRNAPGTPVKIARSPSGPETFQCMRIYIQGKEIGRFSIINVLCNFSIITIRSLIHCLPRCEYIRCFTVLSFLSMSIWVNSLWNKNMDEKLRPHKKYGM